MLKIAVRRNRLVGFEILLRKKKVAHDRRTSPNMTILPRDYEEKQSLVKQLALYSPRDWLGSKVELPPPLTKEGRSRKLRFLSSAP